MEKKNKEKMKQWITVIVFLVLGLLYQNAILFLIGFVGYMKLTDNDIVSKLENN